MIGYSVLFFQVFCFLIWTQQKCDAINAPQEPPAICSGELHAGQSSSNITVKWSLINETAIRFVVTANGIMAPDGQWIGLGFSTQPLMFPADVVIGTGSFVEDRFSSFRGTPRTDPINNLFDASISVLNTVITLEFSRNITSTESGRDMSLDGPPLYWIWASGRIGSTDILYHGQERGVFDGPIDIFSCLTEELTTSRASLSISLDSTLDFSMTSSLTPFIDPSLTPSHTPIFVPSSLLSSFAPYSFTSPSLTPSHTPNLTPSLTPSRTPNLTPSLTPSQTSTLAPFLTPSQTPNLAPSLTPSHTPTLAPSLTTSVILSSPSARLESYRFFMRFFVELLNISNNEAESLSTIVEAIQFIPDVGAFCTKVEMQTMDSFDRVECTVTGITDPLQPDSTSTNIYYTIVDELISLDYLQPETNISSENGFCNFERSIDERGTYLWVESVVGRSIVLPCDFGPTNEVATRTCALRLVWDIPLISNCATLVTGNFVNVNTTASTSNNLTIEDVLSFAEDLSSLSSNAVDGVDQSVTNIEVIQNVMTIASQFYSMDQNVGLLKPEIERTVSGFIQTLEAVETWPEENLQESGSSLTQTLNGLVNNLALQSGIDNLSVDGQTISMRITAQPAFETLTLIAESSESLPISSSVFNRFVDITNNQTQTGSISMLTTSGSYLVAYKNNELFQSDFYTPSTVVMDLTLASRSTNMSLDGTVNITLAIDNPDNLTIESAKCGFWDTDLEKGRGDWSFIGLIQLGNTGEHVSCQSTHLTAFAAFANFSDESQGMPTDSMTTDPVPLEGARLRLVSCLGIGVCLGFLLIVVITSLAFENVRKKSVSVFNSQLCAATMCLLIILLTGINSTAHVAGCIAAGTLLHYFILANWMWFAAEAGHLLIKTYFIFYKSSYQYLTIFSLICWGAPLLVIVITLSVSPMSYINEEDGYCFIGNFTMFLTVVVVPMGLVVLMNIFIYSITIIAVVKYDTDHPSQEKSVYSQQYTIKDILTITGLMVLFIVSASLLVQAFSAQAPVFQVFFATACIVYGLHAFAFFVIFSKDSRDSWKRVFRIFKCKCTKKYGYSVNRLNKQEVLGMSDATGVTVVSRQFHDEVHANPMAEEDTTFDHVMPHPAILTTVISEDANTSTDGSTVRENVYIEVVGEIENIYSDPENLEEPHGNNTLGNGTTAISSENRLSKASSHIAEADVVVFENANNDSDEISD